jgi:hypothetical protein
MLTLLKRPWVLGVLALLAAAGVAGGTIYAFRDNLSRYAVKPSREFDAARAPPRPDYANAGAWFALPQTASQEADVFFVHPAAYYGGASWNAPATDSEMSARVKGSIAPLFAGPFAGAANLFIPRYRQAGPYAFMTNQPGAQKARALAYEDLAAAFRNFLSVRNGQRPFAIAAQGQGTLYATRLLHEFVAPDEGVRARFVAAYLADAALPADQFLDYLKPLVPCTDGLQKGCVNAWSAAKQGMRTDHARLTAPVWRADGGFDTTRGRPLVCVNPLTWDLDGRAADITMNLGAARLDPDGADGVMLRAGATGADCWNGLLWVDVQPAPLFGFTGPRYRDLFPPGENLFYENIRQNFVRRLETFADAPAAPEPEPGAEPDPAPAP